MMQLAIQIVVLIALTVFLALQIPAPGPAIAHEPFVICSAFGLVLAERDRAGGCVENTLLESGLFGEKSFLLSVDELE